MNERSTNEQSTPAGTEGRAPAGRRPLNEISRADAPGGRPSWQIPEKVGEHYVRSDTGNAYKSAHREDKIEFVDRGNRMHAYFPISAFTTRSMVEIAEARGWKELEVTGVDKFKQSVYVEAATRGIGVKGYEPTQKDAEILQRREDRKAAHENPMVKAFLEADTAKARTDAAKQFPELKAAFKADAAAVAYADANIDSKKAASQFMGRFRDSIAISLHTGRQLPNVSVDASKEKPAPAQEQDQGRSR